MVSSVVAQVSAADCVQALCWRVCICICERDSCRGRTRLRCADPRDNNNVQVYPRRPHVTDRRGGKGYRHSRGDRGGRPRWQCDHDEMSPASEYRAAGTANSPSRGSCWLGEREHQEPGGKGGRVGGRGGWRGGEDVVVVVVVVVVVSGTWPTRGGARMGCAWRCSKRDL
jgi:hypothetical protein